MTADELAALTDAVVRVGIGRGFLVEWPRWQSRLIITAAHCLPWLPERAHAWADAGEHTYGQLLGPLDAASGSIAADLVFVEPIADLAVLTAADAPELVEQSDAYERLVEDRSVLRVTTIAEPSPGWILSLDGDWLACTVRPSAGWRGRLTIEGVRTPFGTSGSPILRADGSAVGIISSDDAHTRLALDLPGWLLTDLAVT